MKQWLLMLALLAALSLPLAAVAGEGPIVSGEIMRRRVEG